MKQSRFSKFLHIAPALLAIIVDNFGWGLVYPLAVAIIDDPTHGFFPHGSTIIMQNFYLSLSFFLYPLCMLFGASSLGDLSDIYGRKKILVVATLGIGCSFLLMGISTLIPSIGLFLLGRALSGLMAGTVPIAQATIVDLSSPEDKPFNLAFLSLAFIIGLVSGPLVGSLLSDTNLVSWFHYSTPLFFSGILALITSFWIQAKFAHQERLHPAKTFNLFRPITLFKEAFRNSQIRHLAVTLFLFQLGVSLYIQTILSFMDLRIHYTSLGLGLFWVIMGLGFVAGLFILKKIQVKITTPARFIFFALMTQALSIILSSLFSSGAPLWIFGFAFSLCNPLSYSMLMALFSDVTPQESQGWIMGIWSSVVAVSFAIGGLCNNLVPYLGLDPVIFLGGAIVSFSALYLRHSVKKSS